MHPEQELFSPVHLCDAQGNLDPAAIGFSRHPLHTCNLSGHPLRKKRWNYWCITTPEFLFSATLSNIDYLGLAFIYFLDFNTLKFTEQTIMAPFGRGCNLPDTVNADIHFSHKKLQLAFMNADKGVDLKIISPDFAAGALQADLHVSRPSDHETLNVVIPWSRNRFQFTSKQNCLPATGKIVIGEHSYLLPEGASFACLDFGRGVWKYATFWNWASFSSSGLGVNLGAGWTDDTGYNENGLTINGVLHKIHEDIAFIYNPKDYMQPWTLRTKESNRVDLTFTPFYERVAITSLVVLSSEVHQMVGRFNGSVISDDGKQHNVTDAIGWAEDHHARW